MYLIEFRISISEEALESSDQDLDTVLKNGIDSLLQKIFSQSIVRFKREAERWVEEAILVIACRIIGTLREGYSLEEVRQLISDEVTYLVSGVGYLAAPVLIEEVTSSDILIRISEEPLTAHNLTTIISALTELHTKCWLIARSRFADLIEYTLTHNIRFVDEANLVITNLRYNSPAEIGLAQGESGGTKSKSDSPINVNVAVEATPQAVMQALGTAIDGVVQVPLRFKEKQLEIQAKAQDLKQAEQKAVQESQMALLEKAKRELENERLRLELVEKNLEIQKKGIEYALEIASKTVDVLYSTANAEAKAMVTRTLLPTILQLDNVKGLELVLPVLQSSDEKTETK